MAHSRAPFDVLFRPLDCPKAATSFDPARRSLLLCKSRGRDAGRVEWKFAEIDSILRNAESSIAIARRACDESSYRLHECSGSAPQDVSARALHPQLRPGGIAGPLGEDARLADQWVRVLPRHAFERRPRPRRGRAETLRARRVGGGALLLRARARAHSTNRN